MEKNQKRTIVIAEAGVNHNGSIATAKKLVNIAEKAGADYVKFQTFITEETISKKAKKAQYQIDKTGDNETQFEMVKNLELNFDEHLDLKRYCDNLNVKYLSTGFDFSSIDFLASMDIPFFKIPSGEINNYPYLKKIASLNKPIVMSTGMSTLTEVEEAINTLIKFGSERDNISLLHCVTDYPANFYEINLKAMITMRDTFNLKVGYSDHSTGIHLPIAAVALGAEIIEKHFTIDRNMVGPDHSASLEPNELISMVNNIRDVEVALGDGIKCPSKSEINNISVVRKSIVAKIPIKKGEIFSEKNITTKRPSNGISPMRWEEIIGCVSGGNYDVDEIIEL